MQVYPELAIGALTISADLKGRLVMSSTNIPQSTGTSVKSKNSTAESTKNIKGFLLFPLLINKHVFHTVKKNLKRLRLEN